MSRVRRMTRWKVYRSRKSGYWVSHDRATGRVMTFHGWSDAMEDVNLQIARQWNG